MPLEIREVNRAYNLIAKLFHIKIVRVFLVTTFIATLFPIIVFIILAPKQANDIKFGVTFSNRYATEIGLDWKDAYLKILDELKVKNIRLVVYWDEVEKEPGQYDFSNIKWQLEEADKRNLNVILALGKKVPRWPECFEPYWYLKESQDSKKEEYLLNYVKATTNELKNYNSIKMWQVENEPYWPFGICTPTNPNTIDKEVAMVRSIKNLPILIQDSGEGGYWYPTYSMGDYLGISMYRRIWFDFWGVLFGKAVYFQYPLTYWTYKLKADFTFVPYKKVIVTELQAEPWGPDINSKLTKEQKDKTMSRELFLDTMSYATKTGFNEFYLWGVEWWLWEKEKNDNPFFWESAKALIN